MTKKKGPGGRPTDYNEEIANKICNLYAAGLSTREIVEQKGMPDPSTIYLWLSKHTEFSDKYARAKADGVERSMDKLNDIAEQVLEEDGLDPQRARVAADIIKWRTSQLAPKKYGEKRQIEHSGKIGLADLSDEALTKKLEELEDDEEND